MTPTIVQTVKLLTLTTDTPTSVNIFTTKANSSTGANITVASKPSMYPGIEKIVKFSGNQDAGEDAGRQYMQATENFQKLRS